MAGPAPPPPPPSSSSRESSGSAWVGGLVFAGTSERDVALSKSFWSSVTLQPPLESRLVQRWASSADVAPTARRSSANAAVLAATSSSTHRRSVYDLERSGSLTVPPQTSFFDKRSGSLTVPSQTSFFDRKDEKPQKDLEPELEYSDEKRQYLEKAKTREEIIALLRKRREERIMKEMVFQRHKPKVKLPESKVKTPEPDDQEDQESVKALT